MARDNSQVSDSKRVKRAFKVAVGQIAPTAFLLALRAFRAVRKANDMQNRELELLMAIDVLSERNEEENGERSTCKAEIDTLLKDVMDRKTIQFTAITLTDAGYIQCAPAHTRWTYRANDYSVTLAGRGIIKQYKRQLEALQIELNTAKITR